MKIEDFGLTHYRRVWDRQHILHEILKETKDSEDEIILIGEHPDVYTLGAHGKESNLLIEPQSLGKIEVIRIERGGDITYHGPGQLIAYPILNLENYGLGVKKYMHLLEESVIRFLKFYGIIGERVEGATGIWLGKGTPQERKICAMGVKISKFVTMHGIGLNVNTDLSGFKAINPCGFTDKGVTSVANELGWEVDMQAAKEKYCSILMELLEMERDRSK